jgi:hypothetical protein
MVIIEIRHYIWLNVYYSGALSHSSYGRNN